MTHAQTISMYQPTLQSVAYNLLGSIADAEDAVHDTFVKWLTIDTSQIDNTKAYLIKMVTNSCMNIIQLKKNRQKLNIESLESTLIDREKETSLFHFDIDNQLTEAWKHLCKKLAPLERSIFVLREVFNIDYEEVQEIVGKKSENCRQILSRAKTKLRNTELPKIQVTIPDLNLIESFKGACKHGHVTQLLQDLSSDLFMKKK
ncbi:MAG: sigma-70 family RNA polymerase sigma factor [Bacteroidota bacterium]